MNFDKQYKKVGLIEKEKADTHSKSVKPVVLFMGAFPKSTKKIYGGNVTDCRIVMGSFLPCRVELVLIDTTQISNPPPNIVVRAFLASFRFIKFVMTLEKRKPNVSLFFVADGASAIEKGIMARYSSSRGVPALLFPRAGGLINQCYERKWFGVLIRWLFGGSIGILCQGKSWFRFATGYLNKTKDSAPIVESWTATEELLKIGKGRFHGEDSTEHNFKRIIFVGWVEYAKGIKELLEAFFLVSRSEKVFLDIIGQGQAGEFAKNYVKEFGLENQVIFHGWKSNKELEGLYKQADIFVLPSWKEGLPNAMIEAMAAGLPVITTPVGEIPNTIDGNRGILVPVGSVEELAKALLRVIQSRDLRFKLGKNGYEHAKNHWRAELGVSSLYNAMLSVCDFKER